MSGNDSDDEPQLSALTLAALQEFYLEESKKKENIITASIGGMPSFQEDWQLSQFWYDEHTTNVLANEGIRETGENGTIALVSCPTIYRKIKALSKSHKVCLFEFDERFAAYGEDFYFYDYRHPLQLPTNLAGNFDIVIADPPFLSEECLTKTAITIKFLAKKKVLLCTGEVMADLAERLLHVTKTSFEPRHSNNLANEFRCFTNYPTKL